MKRLLLSTLIFLNTTSFAVYHSQSGQDAFLKENYFANKKSGVFVDIGAHDGVTFSDTCTFEQEQGWTGLCIEPNPDIFPLLQKNRKCTCIQGCIAPTSGKAKFLKIIPKKNQSPTDHIEMLSGIPEKYDHRHLMRIQRELAAADGNVDLIEVQCYTLNELLEKNKISHIDFLTIDTEGGEYEILSSIDFSRFQIDVITVEDNYGDPRFMDFFARNGYLFVKRIATDLVFAHKTLKRSIDSSKLPNIPEPRK